VGVALLFIHILAAGTWLGANVTQLVVNPMMQKSGGAPAAAWMRQTVRMGRVIYTPAAIVLLITGIWMVIRESVYDFEQFFVAVGVLMVIVGGVLGMKVFGPGGTESAGLHESGDEAGAVAVNSRLGMWSLVDTAALLFTIYAMVKRLGI
jgi:hypothetical protein